MNNEFKPNGADQESDIIDITFPRLSPDLPDYCPATMGEIVTYIRLEVPAGQSLETKHLLFLRTALVFGAQMWLWQFIRPDGIECFVTVLTPLHGEDRSYKIWWMEKLEDLSTDQHFLLLWEGLGEKQFEMSLSSLIRAYSLALEANDIACQKSLEDQLRRKLTSILYDNILDVDVNCFFDDVYASFSINETGDLEVVGTVDLWTSLGLLGHIGYRNFRGTISIFDDQPGIKDYEIRFENELNSM